MAGNGILTGEVGAAYSSLFNKLEDVCAGANCDLVRKNYSITKPQDDIAELDAYVHLKCNNRRKQPLSIVVHAQEMIWRNRKPATLYQSTVRVYYYRVKDNGANLLHSVHYDYKEGAGGKKGEDWHPIFHAQICNDTVNIDCNIARKLRFEYTVDGNTPICFREARIPTSDMTLPSVLLCIAADHFRPTFPEFLASVRRIQDSMPMPDYEKTRSSIRQHDTMPHLRSSHWYAHMQT